MRFVIICAARTGSSHFVSSLGGHPDIFMNGNIFDAARPDRLYVFWPKEDVTAALREELCTLRANDPQAFLDRICSVTYARAHVGFKIFEGENDTFLDRMLADHEVRKIVLYRRNLLASFSSALVARETGQYGQRDGKTRPEPPKVRFSANKFAKFHDRYVAFFDQVTEKLTKNRQFYFMVNYEDINEPRVLADIVSFVGGDATKPFSRDLQYKAQVKQNSLDILSRFSNPRAVRKYLTEAGLLHWMREGELDMGRRLSAESLSDDEPSMEPDGERQPDDESLESSEVA
jgi:hypothetical protein